MNHLLAMELAGLLFVLSCLPTWLAGKWYAARGAPPALKRSFVINLVLTLVGIGLACAAAAMGMRQPKPMLAFAFGLLGLAGLLVSAALHAFDEL